MALPENHRSPSDVEAMTDDQLIAALEAAIAAEEYGRVEVLRYESILRTVRGPGEPYIHMIDRRN